MPEPLLHRAMDCRAAAGWDSFYFDRLSCFSYAKITCSVNQMECILSYRLGFTQKIAFLFSSWMLCLVSSKTGDWHETCSLPHLRFIKVSPFAFSETRYIPASSLAIAHPLHELQ
jgi:hypothetical protein